MRDFHRSGKHRFTWLDPSASAYIPRTGLWSVALRKFSPEQIGHLMAEEAKNNIALRGLSGLQAKDSYEEFLKEYEQVANKYEKMFQAIEANPLGPKKLQEGATFEEAYRLTKEAKS
jgi:Dynamin GTPase effector domain